jgi:EAL domain-containing protein (putative c-di-GMP-specific phosphodiesterase class I)
LELLKDLGCDEFQGYFISKPLAATEIAGAVWFKTISQLP